MKVAPIVGSRPEFVQVGPVLRALRRARHRPLLIHTGQHYDPNMSARLFSELSLSRPAHYLGVGSGEHGQQTGRILERA